MDVETEKTINYSDIFFSCSCDDEAVYSRVFSDHLLVYVCSGELVLEEGGRRVSLCKDECLFIARDRRIRVFRRPRGQEQFRVIILVLRRKLLRDIYYKPERPTVHPQAGRAAVSILKILPRPDITSLFLSLAPYYDTHIEPGPEILSMKVREGVLILLKTDRRFYPCLFDFTEAWKIDIPCFLNENYMYELTVKEIAAATGRSLSAFKRDFKKLSGLPPRKWLIQRRLEAAYDKICGEGRSPGDVYLEVGFKNLSHFYQAFKKKYGYPPGKLRKE